MRVQTALPNEWEPALELALGRLDDDVRPSRVLDCLALIASGEIDPNGIFVARSTGRPHPEALRGVLVCIRLPGASGLFWTPRTIPPDAGLEDELVSAALTWLGASGAKLAQAILHPADAPCAGPLLRNGFQCITRLTYLEHALDSIPAAGDTSLRYITYSETSRELFHATLLRTYEGTLDCPEVNGLRTLEEIIAGHQGQGRHRPELWWLALQDDEAVGVAMVADAPDLGAWDLSYLGIVPEARRRGFGRALATQVLRTARAAAAPRLILAVDERNAPAYQLYRALGFVSAESREVYLKPLGPPLAEPALPKPNESHS